MTKETGNQLLIGGKLRVVSMLGEGGMGLVYLAEHHVLERLFAVKVLREDMVQDEIAVERFRREARAASRLQHRNIVYISDFGQLEDGRLYLVMEYIPGKRLDEVIEAEGPLPVERCCRILMQVADALDYAHEQGVVHRDLKPENILLTEHRGRMDLVKVLDFGLAKILGDTQTPITVRGQIYGTPDYMAPEQITGRNVDHRADIYTLGSMAFEMLTGRVPFPGTMMEQLLAHKNSPPPRPSAAFPEGHLPRALDELVLRAMAKDPSRRYQRAADMVDVLRQVLRDLEAETERKAASLDGLMAVGGPQHSVKSTLRYGAAAGATYPTPPEYLDAESADTRSRLVARLEENLRGGLYHMAQTLRDRDMGGPVLTRKLASCLATGERIYAHQTEISSLVSRIEDMEAVGRERESRLRYAIIDLGIELARVEDEIQAGRAPEDADNMVADLTFQIGELERRLAEVAARREQELAKMEDQLRRYRQALEELRLEQAGRDGELLTELMAYRHQMLRAEDLKQMVGQLDEIKKKIEDLSGRAG